MKTVWKVRPKEEFDDNLQVLNFPDEYLHILKARGAETQEQINTYLKPLYEKDILDPLTMKDLAKARDAILEHVEKGSKILVHGDYDVDGLTATRTLVETLEHINATVEHVIPSREEGYGLNPASRKKILEGNYNLVVTVDCGIRDHEIIDELMQNGIDVIVTDHHQPADTLPKARVVVNPSRKDETYENTKLCGAGVAFKLSQAIIARTTKDEAFVKKLLDLTALGTLGDIMPLVGENRAIVKFGLMIIAVTKRIGIAELASANGVNIEKISAMDAGFKIIPFLNAAGRLGDPEVAYQLLAAKDAETARNLVDKLTQINNQRKEITKEACEEIGARVNEDEHCVFEASEKWPRGIAGLIANRLTEQFSRPAFVIEIMHDKAVGSARSIPEINVTDILEKCSEHLVVYGGHHQAAGFTVKKESLEDFEKDVRKCIDEALEGHESVIEHNADLELGFGFLDFSFLSFLKQLEPFGEGNAEPVFMTKNLEMTDLRWLGSEESHLKVQFTDDDGRRLSCIGFGRTDLKKEVRVGSRYDIMYYVRENVWNGTRSIDLHLVDLRKTKP